MVNEKTTETGWRGSRDLWLTAAYESLIDSGVDAVRILAIGKKLGLARTSFYWFFPDRQALLDALLELWREKNIGNLIKQTSAYASNIAEAILNLFDCWLDRTLFDSQFEFAVRSWALQSARVGAEIEKADNARLAAITTMFERFGYSPIESDVRARTIYLTQIGYISMNTREDLAIRIKRIPYYVEIFTGIPVASPEVARFNARHSLPAAVRRGRKRKEAA
jgi:AcrR family transcriptional regulator